jgi:hypothetical protein
LWASHTSTLHTVADPEEDYSRDMKKPAGKEGEKNAKQKALAKSAEGTKNIMSFFKKK